MKNFSLREKTIFIVALLSMSFISLAYFYTSQEILNGYLAVERNDVALNLSRVDDAIMKNINLISSKMSVWAQWDDAYKFVQDGNKKFVKSNLQTDATALKMNVISFWNDREESLWTNYFNLKTDKDEEKISSLNVSDFNFLKSSRYFHDFQGTVDKKFGFVRLANGPYLLVSFPVTSTDAKSPVKGTLITGILLDDDFFKNLSNDLHVDVVVSDLNPKQEIRIIQPVNTKEMNAFSTLKDLKGNPLLTYKISMPREIYKQSQDTLKTIWLAMVFSGLFILASMYWCIDKFIVSRISILTHAISEIQASGTLNHKAPDLGGDEIGQLAISYNNMLNEIEKFKSATFHNEKMASLGEMAGGIAHEINNPMAIISGATHSLSRQLAQKEIDKEKCERQIETIKKSIQRVTKVVAGLKNISRDTAEEDFELTSLHTILNDAWSICSERFKNHQIKLRSEFSDQKFHIEFEGLPVQLAQVFFNLLTNSYDAIDGTEHPWIEVNVASNEDFIEVRFTDSGPGIPLSLQKKIFDPFYTTKAIGKGTGLGLSLANAVIKKHRGEFGIDTQHSHTSFIIKLPRKQSSIVKTAA